CIDPTPRRKPVDQLACRVLVHVEQPSQLGFTAEWEPRDPLDRTRREVGDLAHLPGLRLSFPRADGSPARGLSGRSALPVGFVVMAGGAAAFSRWESCSSSADF